ncbi:DUF6011 domain-containing protein [Propionibacteriaceae bacterium Y1923]
MRAKEDRPGVVTEATGKAFGGAALILPELADSATVPTPTKARAHVVRCVVCGHPVTASRSVARRVGPVCFRRLLAQLRGVTA